MICTEPSFDTVARFNELPNLWDVNEAKNEQVTEETFKTLGQLFVAHHVKIKTDKLASSAQGFNWRITPDKSYVPYEFRPATKNLLNELDLTHIFSICTINKEDLLKPGLEHTEGRKNITVPLADSEDTFDKIIEALWVFKHDSNKKAIQRACNISCGWCGSNGHIKLHSPT
ncbi:6733_t:CDS:2 [Entrophospora sp. SA101]|nr:9555_t:CDS:2 [Entrophospora sp. SA101]CAJ0633352.1 6733_t:CDS:2 [Entrophospora sp. SA101]CAJ0915614.1 6694_t:CDS:2 [Entrophospora sp. SA101]